MKKWSPGRDSWWSIGRVRPLSCPLDSTGCDVEVPRLEVSSTDLRARVRDGRPLDYLVTEPVLDIIAMRKLYRFAA